LYFINPPPPLGAYIYLSIYLYLSIYVCVVVVVPAVVVIYFGSAHRWRPGERQTFVFMCLSIYIGLPLYVSIYLSVYICLFIFMSIYLYVYLISLTVGAHEDGDVGVESLAEEVRYENDT